LRMKIVRPDTDDPMQQKTHQEQIFLFFDEIVMLLRKKAILEFFS